MGLCSHRRSIDRSTRLGYAFLDFDCLMVIHGATQTQINHNKLTSRLPYITNPTYKMHSVWSKKNPSHGRLHGDLAYLEVTLPDVKATLHVTATPLGFYGNRTTPRLSYGLTRTTALLLVRPLILHVPTLPKTQGSLGRRAGGVNTPTPTNQLTQIHRRSACRPLSSRQQKRLWSHARVHHQFHGRFSRTPSFPDCTRSADPHRTRNAPALVRPVLAHPYI